MMAVPSVEVVYLETALALSEAGQHEEAILICDQILSKVTKPVAMATTGKQDHENDNETTGTSSRTNSTKICNRTNSVFDVASTSTDPRQVDVSKTLPARKRPRDDDSISSQSSKVMTNPSKPIMKGSQTKWKQLHLFCSALLMKSQCFRAVHQVSKVEGILDEILDCLSGLTFEATLGLNSADGSGESTSMHLEPQTKKRRLNTENPYNPAQSNQPTPHLQCPIIKSLLELKTQASNDKALILIGRGKLQEAMKILLRSLQYQSGNHVCSFLFVCLF